jgi:maleamate amidohydrolase
LSYLIDRRIDTLIVTGGSTCNCVRATVFDAFSYNFRTIVPSDAVFDRMPISQAINLFDMNRCSADVVETSEVLDYLADQNALIGQRPNMLSPTTDAAP